MTIELSGPWYRGYAYDVHTLSSVYLGTDEYGHAQFDSTYSEMGELVRKLKYKSNRSAVGPIVDRLGKFKGIETYHAIIPVPSSQKKRPYQPVEEIARELGRRTGVPILIGAFEKAHSGRQLKNIDDYDERIGELRRTISLSDTVDVAGKDVLLVDDLYRSGATLSVCTEILIEKGNAAKVSVLTMTKTRSNR